MSRHDVVVIGAGTGGYACAIKAAQLGLSCAIVEERDVGGTCLNRGCIPTKTILHATGLVAEIARAATFGVVAAPARVDHEALRSRVDAVVGQLRGGIERLLAANGVEIVRGRARVEGEGRVSVDGEDGATSLEAGAIVVATGSSPARPPIPGIDLPGVVDSDFLTRETPAYRSLAVIGGGVIGAEFATAYADLGADTTVLEMEPRLLPTMDRELGQSLAAALKSRGARVEAGASVQAIEQAEDSLRVSFERKGKLDAVEADAVLVATGRRANVASVFAEGFAPELDRGRIAVDARMRASLPGVYAVGDVANAGPQLAHAASAQGIAAACAIAGEPCGIDLMTVPACVYTAPEIASVGLTEAEAKEAGIAVRTAKFAMGGNAKTVIAEAGRGFVKIVADESGAVIGAQLLCERASDIVAELALAVANGLSARDVARTIHPHPTFAEGAAEAAEALCGGSIHTLPRK